MSEASKDQEIIAAMLERMTKQRIPRALDLKAKVDRGEVLSDLDIEFLTQIMKDADSARTIFARNPEYMDLAARAVALYHEITTKALENEKAAG